MTCSRYQAPVPEHPETDTRIENAQIHANHVEAFNASLRRRNSAFRRKLGILAVGLSWMELFSIRYAF